MIEKLREAEQQPPANTAPSAPLQKQASLENLPPLQPLTEDNEERELPPDPRLTMANNMKDIATKLQAKTIDSDQAIEEYKKLANDLSPEAKRLIVDALTQMMSPTQREFFWKLRSLDITAQREPSKKDFVDAYSRNFEFETTQANFANDLENQFQRVCKNADTFTCTIMLNIKNEVIEVFNSAGSGLDETTETTERRREADGDAEESDDRFVDVDVPEALAAAVAATEQEAGGGEAAAGIFTRLSSALSSGGEAVAQGVAPYADQLVAGVNDLTERIRQRP